MSAVPHLRLVKPLASQTAWFLDDDGEPLILLQPAGPRGREHFAELIAVFDAAADMHTAIHSLLRCVEESGGPLVVRDWAPAIEAAWRALTRAGR